MPNDSDNRLILLWTGFALMISTVLLAGGLMIVSIINDQYLWLIPISAYLYWVVQRGETLIGRWTQWVVKLDERG